MPQLSETFRTTVQNLIAFDQAREAAVAQDPFAAAMPGAYARMARRNDRHPEGVQARLADDLAKIEYARQRAAGQVEETPKGQAEVAPELADEDVDLYDDDRTTEEVLAELGLEPPASLEFSGEESLEEATKAADDQLERLIASTRWEADE